MDLSLAESDIRTNICNSISFIYSDTKGTRVIINTPFIFDDGDVIKIVLRRESDGWYLTDEGHTFMHLSYDDLDLTKGRRKILLDTILLMHYIENVDGELRSKVDNSTFGDSFFTFIQGLNKISNLSFTRKDHIKSLFMEDFFDFLKSFLSDGAIFNYADPEKDEKKRYRVDCYIPARKPVFVFGVNTDDKCRDTTITLLKFENWGVENNSIVVFEDMQALTSKAVAKLSDVSGKVYSDLGSAKERMPKYLKNITMPA
ncbi:MAG: DUF1828 domain-containing protein [Methanothrix sp.]|nr:DUF1828 domain-containing protein [Methanothrix sp.]